MDEDDRVQVHPRTESSTPEGGDPISSTEESSETAASGSSSSRLQAAAAAAAAPPVAVPATHTVVGERAATAPSSSSFSIPLIQRAVEACQKGAEDELAGCLRAGIKPNDVDGDGCSLLHWAAINNHEKVIKRLLQEGADPNMVGGILISAPLHWAARVGNLNACALLARAGARCDLRDTQGYTPMHLAVQGCYTAIVAYFIHHFDVAVNVTDNAGMTSAMWCAYRNFDMFPLRLLVRAGADLRQREMLQGNTALHFACQERNLTAVKELLAGGADVGATNNQQETPLDVAKNTRNAKIIKLLEAACRQRGTMRASCVQKLSDNQPLMRTVQFTGPSIFFCLVYLLFHFLHPGIAVVVVAVMGIVLRMKLDIHRVSHTLVPVGITVAEALMMLATWSLSPAHWWVPWWAQLAFLFFMTTLLSTLIRCALFDAGTIPPSARPYEEFKQIVDEKRLSYFCYSCFVNRPAGSKHCAICDKCVLHFDHHCPWLNACVTKRNHREFLLFVFSVGMTSLIFGTSMIAFFSQYLREHSMGQLLFSHPWEIFTFCLSFIHVILMMSLFGVQSMQIAQGVTTNQLLKRQGGYPRQGREGGGGGRRMGGDQETGGHGHSHDPEDNSGCVFYIRNCLNFCAGH